MKTLSGGVAAAIAGDVSTLATLWKVTRRDATVFGFTDHDQPLTVGGVVYSPNTAFVRSAIRSAGDLSVDNLDVQGVLDSAGITEADLLAGVWDHAEVEIRVVNWANPGGGSDVLRRGWIGEVRLTSAGFVAEVRGLAQKLAKPIVKRVLPACAADLGDSDCGVALGSFTVAGTVTSVSSRSQFQDSARGEADNLFRFGKLTFTTGANAGLSLEVKTFTQSSGDFVLVEGFPYAIEVGDAYSVYRGCDKTIATCRDVFSNVPNYRGFPFVPGSDQVFSIGAQ